MLGRIMAAAAAALLLTRAVPAAAAPTLAYDTASYSAAPGASIRIGATLSLGLSDQALVTNLTGAGGSSYNPFVLYVAQAWTIDSMLYGTLENTLHDNSTWVPPAQNPVAGLNIAPGGSAHLDLGAVVLGTALPYGTYTADIGVFMQCSAPSICSGLAFQPPNYADAGQITIDVAPVDAPEPTAAALLATGLLATAAARKGRAS